MRKFILIVALLFTSLAQAGDLRYIQLHNRQASELVPVLQPLLESDDAITGSDYTLIVRTTPQRFQQIEAMARQLDTAQQQLVISVRTDGNMDQSIDEYSANGSVGRGNIRIGVETPSPTAPGGSITTYGSSGSGSFRAYSSNSQRSSNASQRLMVLDGQWATINAGQTVPIQRQIVTQSPYGRQVQTVTEYADATSGFDVRPRLNGSDVTLEIAPYQRKLSSQGIDTQSISSTVRGALGEWIEIGGVNESSSASASGIANSGSSGGSNSRSVWLKVELAH